MATATTPGYRTRYTVKAPDRSGEHEGDMEGTSHASTGLLLGAGVGLLTTAWPVHGAAAWDAIGRDLLYGVLVAGFALLPDADHPKASFAYAAGVLSHGTSHLVATLFGGHRQGFHSLAGIGVMSLVTAACASWWPNRWALAGLALFIAVCVVAGLKAAGFLSHGGRSRRGGLRRAVIGSTVAALAVTYVRADLWWLVALGMALHIFEDEFTGHGCALAWPLSRRRFGGDGHQPGSARSGTRRPKSGFQQARERAERRPVTPKPPARPGRGPGKPMCPACWVGECDACKDRGCGCPQASHPARPGKKSPALPPAYPDDPPY